MLRSNRDEGGSIIRVIILGDERRALRNKNKAIALDEKERAS